MRAVPQRTTWRPRQRAGERPAPKPRSPLTLTDLADDQLLDRAFAWLCHRRRHYPADADIWAFRHRWSDEKRRLQGDLRGGHTRLGLLTRITKADGTVLDVWSARDALVLKALALVLQEHLPRSRRCTHLKGHGGSKAAVRAVRAALPAHRFVCKSDVRSYYDSIDHTRLLDRVARIVPDRGILNLVGQYLRRTSEAGGDYWTFTRGLSLGCPLSPVIGAFFLLELDRAFEGTGLFYVRFMDDIVVLAPTRWKLRAAVRQVQQTLTALGLATHPDKTFIGRVEHGFDFLGYHLTPSGLSVAPATWRRFCDRAHRLYEQERGTAEVSPRLGAYVRRWAEWHRAGLGERPGRKCPTRPSPAPVRGRAAVGNGGRHCLSCMVPTKTVPSGSTNPKEPFSLLGFVCDVSVVVIVDM